MADPEREGSYYHPGGIPVTPQARRFGYAFPVYVSDLVWRDMCIAANIPGKRDTTLEKRIWHLLQYCYDGMTKKLAVQDDFLFYEFKARFWRRDRPFAKKMSLAKLGARLFIDPSTDGPWLYIFDPRVDSIDALKQGEPNGPVQGSGEAPQTSAESSEVCPTTLDVPHDTREDSEVRADGDGPNRSPSGD